MILNFYFSSYNTLFHSYFQMQIFPLTQSKIKSLLSSLHHNPSKKLGQNFLIDNNITQKSLQLAQVSHSDTILEVGPGLGSLTFPLLSSNATVHSIEKDPSLIPFLQQHLLPLFPSSFHLHHQDALLANIPSILSQSPSYKIVANLPYAISTPLLEKFLSPPLPTSMTLMLQKEAAERFVARHNSKPFSPISILILSAYSPTAFHKVSPSCFYPIPKVDSVLLHLQLKPSPILFSKSTYSLIRTLFNYRRKQLLSTLKQQLLLSPTLLSWLDYLLSHNIPPQARPESIPLEHWQKLDFLLNTTT